MQRSRWAGALAGTAVAAGLLSGCVAPDVEILGGLGVTIDAQGQAILVVEPCGGSATLVDLAFDREGLAAEEENKEAGRWTASPPASGITELHLATPSAPWQGEGVEIESDRGYIAGGQGSGDLQVLTQVAFRGTDLAGLDPAMVYTNDHDPDVTTLVAHTREEFTTLICERAN